MASRIAAYHSTWYLPAIRELIASAAFREDPEWIAEVLWPKIKASEVLIALVETERDRTQVVQLNLQLFPLTRPVRALQRARPAKLEERGDD